MPRDNVVTLPALQVRKVSDIKYHRSWAIYGRSGSGKTTFSGTFPAPILLLDFRDRGTESVSDKDIEVVQMEEWADIEDVYLNLSRKHKYKSVVFDTITQMQGIAVEEVMTKKKKRITANLGDWGTMTQKEWGEVGSLMKEQITRFRDLPLEVAFLAQERVNKVDADDDDDMLVPEIGPALTPSVASHLNACVSVIGNTFIKVKKRKDKKGEDMVYCLRIGAHSVYTTKVRKARDILIPEYIENPTHSDVIEIISGRE